MSIRRILLAFLVGVFVCTGILAQGSFTQQVQQLASAIGYASSTSQVAVYSKGVQYPSNQYINFGAIYGSGGEGFRDFSGQLQYRNSTGSWLALPAGGAPSSLVKFIVQQPDASAPNAQALSALATGLVLNTTTTGVLSTSLLLPATNFPALTGAITTPGGSLVTTLTNAIVTLAKIQNAVANSKLLGSGAAGSGSPYVELTLGSGLSMSGTTLSSTAAAISTTGGTGAIQYNTAGAFDSSTGLIWTQGSTLLTVTGTTKTTSLLAGNNTPSLSSPMNSTAAISQSWTGAGSAAVNGGLSIAATWAPASGTQSGEQIAEFVQGIPTGSHPFTATTYGVRSQLSSTSSSTVAAENAVRGEVVDSGNSGTTTSITAFEAVIAETNHTATAAFDYYAHGPFVHSGGTITRGVEYFGDDPLQSACTACASLALDFGARGRFQVAPTPTAGTAYGYGSSIILGNLTPTGNADFVAGTNQLVDFNLIYTPDADYSRGTIETLIGQTTIHATHNFANAIISTTGDTFVADGSGNFTESSTGLNGLQGEVDFYGSGTAAQASAFETFIGSGGGGTITNGESIYVTAPYDTSSVVTNYVGLQLDNQTWPGSTVNYAIRYSAPAGKTFGVLANGGIQLGGATMTFPAANASGVLTNNGSGVLSWSSTGLFPLLASAGTSTAPSYSWTTATGVGLYEPSTNQTGVVGGLLIGKTASAANGSILYLSGTGIAATAGNPLIQINMNPGFDAAQTIPTGQNATGLLMSPVWTTAGSGTHALLANVELGVGTYVAGGATVTEAATLYIDGAPTIGVSKYALHAAGGQARFDGGVILKPTVFASVPVSPAVGTLWAISDSTTQTWGATISGGSSSFVIGVWDGAAWTVVAK